MKMKFNLTLVEASIKHPIILNLTQLRLVRIVEICEGKSGDRKSKMSLCLNESSFGQLKLLIFVVRTYYIKRTDTESCKSINIII